ncbi:arrestin domain-containing protein 3-like [Coccinella septempunctata]|uniref:arrestin domain-containing protein 3-like n=1 Tax=Coccinella septempunctata TaxID=41139 RepID=UPI001D09806C|nr:arrestin domain-containing protein 3-like [Coccinella septempunctata]XP_044755835.1 arrestin domain-containing protein 3-like [Coccinella septempunctata]
MSCTVFLDGGPHYSGGEVRGRLECSFHKSEKVRGIKIRAIGEEHTEWIDTENHYDESLKKYITVSYPCTGDNNLFNFEIMLFGGSGETYLGPGIFNYPFSFQLPPNLPSSFTNQHGYIRYGVRGIIDIPWGLDYESTQNFELVSPIDLNTFPMECFQPVSRSDSKTVCCWCCSQGDISLDININKTAFIPGESVKLFLTLTNMSNSNVEEVNAIFQQYLKSKVELPKHDFKEDKFEFSRKSLSGVGAHGENKYDMELLIPAPAPYPNLNRSSLFEISYDIEICAVISGCHSNMELSFNVEIGHIQHQSQTAESYAPPPTEGTISPYPNTAPAYPYPTASQPTAPIIGGPNAGAPYPQISQPTGPPYPTGSGSGAAYPPDYQSVYPGGPPKSPSFANLKEQEAFGEVKQAPSAPPATNELPPSYEYASKNENK